ncbi:hypothetical protein MTR_3g036120 [Medicago truncatula]|uniref:Uncharacterized protein n=1 Tax=Medicago truncatula TaxID=3880 RepID=G7IX82_MEDTR|nr:hypothetical protein MTR_3g036120 [Medicago truncatula]
MRNLGSLSLVVKIHCLWKKLGMPSTVENCDIAVVKNDCPKKRLMQQQKVSCIVVVAEEGTHSEEDIPLVADE